MKVIHLTGKEPLVQAIVRRAYPSYRGNKFKLRITDTVNASSSWQGGSRDYYKFVKLDGMIVTDQMPAQSQFDKTVPGLNEVRLMDGVICVEHSIFQGKDTGITIHICEANAVPLLPAPVELTEAERIVLIATKQLKGSYDGRKPREEAALEHGVDKEQYEAAKASLIARRFLNKAGAITVDGRNAVGNERLVL
jgi:hypothetical protein